MRIYTIIKSDGIVRNILIMSDDQPEPSIDEMGTPVEIDHDLKDRIMKDHDIRWKYDATTKEFKKAVIER